jgi:ubiquinone/menaquinone biosynthesis C-methylase UbiE
MVDFDVQAATWDMDRSKVERALRVAEAVRQRVTISRATSGFEYGCGTGLLSFALRPWLGPIVLADSSAGMLAVASEKIAASGMTGMTTVALDLLHDPLPAERFDLVYTLMTLHHVSDTDAILRAFHDLLADGGLLAIADLDLEDGSFHGPDVEVHHGFERDRLRAQLESAGFCEIVFSTACEVVKDTNAGQQHYPVFLVTARKAR